MTKSVEMREAANAIDLQLVQPPPLTSSLSVADALRQIRNSSSQAAYSSQQRYDPQRLLPDQQHNSLPELCPFTEIPAFTTTIRNTIQPSVWDQRDNPLTDPRQPYFPSSRYSGACDPLDLTFPVPSNTASRVRQGKPSQRDYCFSAEKQVSEAIGSKLERVVQKLAANASRHGQPGQTLAADVSTVAQPCQTPANSVRRSEQSAPSPRAGSRSGREEEAIVAPTASTLRTREWVQQTIMREQELRNAASAVMKDATRILKRMSQPLAEIRQALPDILQKMTEAMPDLIKQQFDVNEKRYTTTQFPAGMQHIAVGVLTRVITLQARAQVNQHCTEARQMREMAALENKIIQLRQRVDESSGAAQQRARRALGKIQGQYRQCLIAMFPQYSCLNSLSTAEAPARMEEMIRYCTDACVAAPEQSQQPIPSQESSTISMVSEDMPSHSADPLSPMHISSPPPLSPVRSISEYSKFSFPPVLSAAEEMVELRHAEAQTDEIAIDDLQSEGVRDAQIQTDDVRSEDMHIVRMQTVEIQTSDILSDEIHSVDTSSPLTPRPAMRRMLIDLDRQTSDSSQTIAAPTSIRSVRASADIAQVASYVAGEASFGTPLLMWESIAHRLQMFGASILEERLLALADYFSLPEQQWRQLVNIYGLTPQGREVMDTWQSKLHKAITETEKTEWLQQFDYYLTQPRQGREKATPPGTRNTTPLASPAIAATPQPTTIAIAGAPNLSLLANTIDDTDAWMRTIFEAVPPMIARSEMYMARNTALVIVTPDDRVRCVFSAAYDHELRPKELMKINSSDMQSIAVILYMNENHYYPWRLADHKAYLFSRPSRPGEIFFNRSGCELKSTVTPGFCLTEAAAMALPGNKNVSGEQAIVKLGAALREQIRQVIIELPARNPRLLANLEQHLSIQQQAEENRE